MNKNLLLACATFALFATQAQAANLTPYVSAKLKYVDMSNEASDSFAKLSVDDNVFGGALAAGVAFGNFRTELEYNLNSDASKKFPGATLKVESQSYMLNGYYDIDTQTKFSPYIMAGVGFADIKGKADTLGSISDTNFAWQAGAGISYEVNQAISLDAGYRYVDSGDFTKYGIKVESDSNEFYIGTRFSF